MVDGFSEGLLIGEYEGCFDKEGNALASGVGTTDDEGFSDG